MLSYFVQDKTKLLIHFLQIVCVSSILYHWVINMNNFFSYSETFRPTDIYKAIRLWLFEPEIANPRSVAPLCASFWRCPSAPFVYDASSDPGDRIAADTGDTWRHAAWCVSRCAALYPKLKIAWCWCMCFWLCLWFERHRVYRRNTFFFDV